MLRVIGLIMVALGPSVMGITKALGLKNRARFLGDFVATLPLMRAEICARLTPMTELMDYLARSAPHGCREFFQGIHGRMDALEDKGFKKIWEEETENTCAYALTIEERAAICALGASLGRYDSVEQRSAIDAASARLSALAEEARIQCGDQCRMWTGLGVFSGLILAVMMI